jgi:hypothetical protein
VTVSLKLETVSIRDNDSVRSEGVRDRRDMFGISDVPGHPVGAFLSIIALESDRLRQSEPMFSIPRRVNPRLCEDTADIRCGWMCSRPSGHLFCEFIKCLERAILPECAWNVFGWPTRFQKVRELIVAPSAGSNPD